METTNDQAQPTTTDEHEGQFFCGICDWCDIADYASHGHEESKQ